MGTIRYRAECRGCQFEQCKNNKIIPKIQVLWRKENRRNMRMPKIPIFHNSNTITIKIETCNPKIND